VATGGTENVVFRLGDELAVRMPRHADEVGGLLKEVRWLSTVARQVSLEVPEVVSVGGPGGLFPFPWAVVRWLPGEDALTGRVDSMPDTARTLGRLVAELQGLDITAAPRPRTTGSHRGAPLAGHDDLPAPPTRRWWRRHAAESAKRSRIRPDPGHLLPSGRSLDEYRIAPRVLAEPRPRWAPARRCVGHR
jgi:aminoglycoside phosphotransferase (APT) family kinase protein